MAEVALGTLYPDGACTFWELLPLRRKDCVQAATEFGLAEPESFVRQIVARGLEPLAIKPLTLELLLRTSKEGPLPESRRDLFERASFLLAKEPNDQYPDAGHGLSPAQRLAVAQRVAAAMLLCGKSTIIRDETDAEAADLILERIAGGAEHVTEATLDVDAAALAETVRTGLFSGAGPSRLGWYHHAVAEFLAARWLAGASLEPRQVDSLLFHPEDPRRVVPQLRVVAGWAAAYDSRILAKLAANEPHLLLTGDATLDEGGRERLVEELLRRLDAVEVHDLDYRLRARYGTLRHSGLAAQLRPVIRDRRRNAMVRRAAIDIAEECALVELEGLLVDVALDAADAYGTRQQAVAALRKIGSPPARRCLRPLVTQPAAEDVDDELRGQALHALWPEHMSSAELFGALRSPKAPLYFGAYAAFVDSLADRVRDEDLAGALDWAIVRIEQSPYLLPAEQKTIHEIVERALHLLSNEDILHAYARFVAASVRSAHAMRPAGWDRLLAESADAKIRRQILLEVLSLLGKDWIPSDGGLLGPNDFVWMVAQLDGESTPKRRQTILDAVLRGMQFGLTFEDLDCVLVAAPRHTDLAACIDGFTRAIDIESETAATLREQRRKYVEMMKRRERAVLDPPPAQRVRSMLADIESGEADGFWRLGWELTLEPTSTHYGHVKARITTLPGWAESDAPTRSRIVSAAKSYLVAGDPKPREWFGRARIYYPAVGGYQALRLLLEVERSALEELSAEIWAKWAPSIATSRKLGNERDPGEMDLLVLAYLSAPDAILDALAVVIREDDRRYKTLFIADSLTRLWDPRVARQLRSMIAPASGLHHDSTAQILRLLLHHAAPQAEAIARRLVLQARIAARVAPSRVRRLVPHARGGRGWTRFKDARERLLSLLKVFLSEATTAAWPTMRQLLNTSRAFCRLFFLQFSQGAEVRGHCVSSCLTAEAAAEWYLWLRREFPSTEDPTFREVHAVGQRESVGHLRDAIFNDLAQRKNFAARDAIRQLARATGDASLLVHAIDVEVQALADTWRPPPPVVLVRMMRDRSARIVASGAHLLEVVLESLARLQIRLQGENAVVGFLWDGGGSGSLRPKDEESLSTFVADHLDHDLCRRGVIINREVEVRPRRGARPGEHTDIHVDAVESAERARARYRVVIESKGNWNQNLEADLDEQLAGRYLADSEARHGIYLIGWYASANWDPKDRRRQVAERRDRAVVEQALGDRARAHSETGVFIELFILDTKM